MSARQTVGWCRRRLARPTSARHITDRSPIIAIVAEGIGLQRLSSIGRLDPRWCKDSLEKKRGEVEKGHFWADSVGGRGHCQLVRLMMGAMRCLVVAPPVHAPWGSARAVTSHACRRRPTECRSVAGDGSCGAPAGLHEAAGGASSRGLSTLACASARGRAMRGCQDASVGSRWRLKCPCPPVSPSLRCLI